MKLKGSILSALGLLILLLGMYGCEVNKTTGGSVLERKISFNFHGIENHVQWQSEAEWQANNDTIELRINVKIDEGWHLYSQRLESNEGPLPTVFEFMPTDSCKLEGIVFEGTAKEEYDKNFGMNVRYFQGKTTFTQRIIRRTSASFGLTGKVNYMVCDNEKCLPPIDVPLIFKIGEK
jgi:thiol:disulfide interchange protein DsbD